MIASLIVELSVALPKPRENDGFTATAASASAEKEDSSVCTLYSSAAFALTVACNCVSLPGVMPVFFVHAIKEETVVHEIIRVLANFIVIVFVFFKSFAAGFCYKRIIYFSIALRALKMNFM